MTAVQKCYSPDTHIQRQQKGIALECYAALKRVNEVQSYFVGPIQIIDSDDVYNFIDTILFIMTQSGGCLETGNSSIPLSLSENFPLPLLPHIEAAWS